VQEDLEALQEEENFLEGTEKKRVIRVYERNYKLRVKAIQHHGLTCAVCGFDFEEFYGSHGENYIEVHHLIPVSTLGAETQVNPKTDMAVLCANCHRMIHRKKDKTLTLEELRSLINIRYFAICVQSDKANTVTQGKIYKLISINSELQEVTVKNDFKRRTVYSEENFVIFNLPEEEADRISQLR
jgi:5-methylcytosine-specific restriction endonuclease McrA